MSSITLGLEVRGGRRIMCRPAVAVLIVNEQAADREDDYGLPNRFLADAADLAAFLQFTLPENTWRGLVEGVGVLDTYARSPQDERPARQVVVEALKRLAAV